MQRNEVATAFEILLEEIELVANELNDSGAKAIRAGTYDEARRAIEEAARLAEFREKVKALQKEWLTLTSSKRANQEKSSRAPRKGRLPRGLRTPEDALRTPILEALAELGGSATIGKVLDLVEKKLGTQLTKYDLEPLPSDPKSVRWRNTAQWCRNSLIREGLMKNDSPYGIWEISDAGWKLVKESSMDSYDD